MRFGRAWAREVVSGVAMLGALACSGDESPPAATAATAATTTTELASSTGAPEPGSTSAPTTTGPPTTGAPDTTEGSRGQVTIDSQTSTTGAPDPQCMPGQITCDGDIALTCDDAGAILEATPCPAACAPALGCVMCVPDAGECDGDVSKLCDSEGHVLEDILCDPLQGLVCDPASGRCVGDCAADSLTASYIGCDYYPTVTPNLVAPSFSFAVAVSNTTGEAAHVTITRGDVVVDVVDVAPGDVEVAELPWIAELKDPAASAIVQGGAYRLRSDRPVTVYQYSPLLYDKREQFSYSNDASLLLPTNVWGAATRVIARNSFQSSPGAYAVVARLDGTLVEITPSATGAPVIPGGGVLASGHGQALLDAGDVLLVISGVGGGTPDIADLTGTLVSASAPVQVIGAHACTNIPHDKQACDHLEESNLPLQNLTTGYFVTAPLVKPPDLPPVKKSRQVRIVATADATALTYEPGQPGAPDMLKKAGDYGEFASDQDFFIGASERVAVAEYMLGQAAGDGVGDPAMTIAVPPELFRDTYAIHAPTNYDHNFINLVAPAGAQVFVDDLPVPAAQWLAIGQTGWAVARVTLGGGGDGDHRLSCKQAFGVQVYGYGQYTSYWYPGGLNLDPL